MSVSVDTGLLKEKKRKGLNLRQKTLITIGFCFFVILGITVAGTLINRNMPTDFTQKNLAPSLAHLFGSDWLGRDMLLRTVKGLSLSIYIGMLACGIGVVIATILGLAAATMGEKVDAAITFVVDMFLSVPHILVMIIVCISVGGGAKGVIIGIAVTHWVSLTRIVRAEVKQLMSSEYIHVARQMGKSKFYIAVKHILPHILPQLIVGFISTFPHAIIHEAEISFLGFGLSPHEPAIGIILSEAMKYLSAGYWWLAFFPGLSLLAVVMLFDFLGDNIDKLTNPKSVHR